MRSFILFALLCTGCWRSNATIRPALTIRVVDSHNAPIAGAHVLVVHRTYPYGVVRDWWPFETGADGTVVTTRLSRPEWVAPLMMHGMVEHSFYVCAGQEGRGVEVVRLDRPSVELRLHDDYRDDCRNSNVYGQADLKGLTPAGLAQSRKLVERLVPTGE